MSAPIDFQRFAFVIQTDHKGTPSATEWKAHASLQEIAQALCDSDLPDCPVVKIIECNPSEGWSRDVTEDVAKLIPAIADEAEREWRKGRIQNCAVSLMMRYLDNSDGFDWQAHKALLAIYAAWASEARSNA